LGESKASLVKQFQRPRSLVNVSKKAPDGMVGFPAITTWTLPPAMMPATASQIPDSMPGASSAMIKTYLP
jgi:hypothetical protein